MANEGFKGTRLGIASVTLQGSQAQVSVQFIDVDGLVHAITKHNVSIGEHEALVTTAEAFLAALNQHITSLHFQNPDIPANQQESQHGIAEALRGGAADSNDSDEFEEGG